MSTQTTSSTPGGAHRMRDALAAVAALADAHPDLPAPYLTVGVYHSVETVLQWQDPDHFEAWRKALGIDSDSVELREGRSSAWLAVETVLPGGVPVRLTGFGVQVAAVEAAGSAVAA